jgi:hypothetical protein
MSGFINEDEKIAKLILTGIMQAGIVMGAMIASATVKEEGDKREIIELLKDPERTSTLALKHVNALIEKINVEDDIPIPQD